MYSERILTCNTNVSIIYLVRLNYSSVVVVPHRSGLFNWAPYEVNFMVFGNIEVDCRIGDKGNRGVLKGISAEFQVIRGFSQKNTG